MNKELLQEIGSEIKDMMQGTILEALINLFVSDQVDFGKNVVELIHQSKSITDIILWNNFYLFLKEGNFDYSLLRKLSAKLDESGNREEIATHIVYEISRIDNPKKMTFLSWLTLSLINCEITLDTYFRLIKAVNMLIYQDLIYLSENIEKITLEANEPRVDDYLSCGLIYSIDGGFAYSDKAYDLVEFGIRRGHEIKRPKEKPTRLVMSIFTDEEISASTGNKQFGKILIQSR